LPSKYTSAVFNQDLSNHILIACICNGSVVKRPPLITVKRSLKNFSEQDFLIDLARVFWKDIDLIPPVDYSLKVSSSQTYLSIPHAKNVETGTDIEPFVLSRPDCP
jgi:hypothetical protein